MAQNIADLIIEKERTTRLGKVNNMLDLYKELNNVYHQKDVNDLVTYYFVKHTYQTMLPKLSEKPPFTRKHFTDRLVGDIIRGIDTLNNYAKFNVVEKRVVLPKVMNIVNKLILDKWYGKSVDKSRIKGDTTAKFRVANLIDNYKYYAEVQPILKNGSVSAAYDDYEGEYTIRFGVGIEGLKITLAKSRSVSYYRDINDATGIHIEGPISKTSLKALKSNVRKATKNCDNKEFFDALADYIDKYL